MQCSRFKQVANQHLVVTAKRINSGCWCFLADFPQMFLPMQILMLP